MSYYPLCWPFLSTRTQPKGEPPNITSIGAKPNLYCKAIELACGGSPKVCVLIEWKARHRVKSEQWQLKHLRGANKHRKFLIKLKF